MTLTLAQPAPVAPLPEPDADQAAVLAAALSRPVTVALGAPGTGKTTTALAVARAAVAAGVSPDRLVVLSPRRRSAGRLRESLALLLGVVTRGPLVRTPTSLAFAVLRTEAVQAGRPLPVLISGPEQDVVLRELLAGHLAEDGLPLPLPPEVPVEALQLRAFRDELRDLLMRAAERGVDPVRLTELAREHRRPAWELGARLYQEYLDVVTLGESTPDRGERLDPGLLVDRAARALEDWEGTPAGRPGWDLVVVDDAHEATQAVGALLRVLHRQGARLVLLGDPDSGVQGYRGAVPTAFLDGFGLGLSEPLVLGTCWRQGERLRGLVALAAEHVRGPVRRHRSARARGPEGGEVTAAVVGSRAQQLAVVARELREARVLRGVPWSRMAVLARSGAQVAALRAGLARFQVPVTVPGAEVPVRDEPAVRPFLLAMRCVVTGEVDEASAVELLTSPLGGLDALGLRRLRKALRENEIAAGGYRASGTLLVEAVTVPGVVDTLPPSTGPGLRALRRVVGVLEAGRGAAAQEGATAATVLWAMWSATGLAEVWRTTALAGGPAGQRADADLDAMLALFKAAERHAERMPQAGPREFLEHLDAQDLTEDTLAPRAESEAVTVCTAASAAGEEWDLVVVAGLQEGTWPDLRLRDSLLGAQGLVDACAGRLVAGEQDLREARRAVLDDELRALVVAVSRARERLLLTAVRDEEQRPSAFLDLLVPPGPEEADPRRVPVPLPLDLRGLVARLRHELTTEPERAEVAARALARLAAAGVPGADPAGWAGLAEPSTTAPLHGPEQSARLSPSSVETLSRCALRWALENAGGKVVGGFSASLGTLVHRVAETLPVGTEEEMLGELARLWESFEAPEGWIGEAQRRRAEAMVRRLAAYVAAHGGVEGTEVDFELDLATPAGPLHLSGRVDRVERDAQGRLRIVDLKTGKSAIKREDAQRHPQLGVYQAALEHGALRDAEGRPFEGGNGGAALVYVGTSSAGATERSQVPLPEDAEPAWVSELLAEARDRLTGPLVLAQTNPACEHCPVRRSCPLQEEGAQVTA